MFPPLDDIFSSIRLRLISIGYFIWPNFFYVYKCSINNCLQVSRFLHSVISPQNFGWHYVLISIRQSKIKLWISLVLMKMKQMREGELFFKKDLKNASHNLDACIVQVWSMQGIRRIWRENISGFSHFWPLNNIWPIGVKWESDISCKRLERFFWNLAQC